MTLALLCGCKALSHITCKYDTPYCYFYFLVGIKFDAFLTSEHALNETCKALKVSSFRESTLRLFVEKLDATCLGQQKIKILLEQLDAEVYLISNWLRLRKSVKIFIFHCQLITHLFVLIKGDGIAE